MGRLPPRGLAMLKEFERVGMILDVTHLSDQSFFLALENFSGPVMASHNNCRALVPGDRQFSDKQLRLIIGRGAVIGVVCDAWMLQPGWRIGVTRPETLTLAALVDQIDHICQVAGSAEHVGVGSDLDGGYGHRTDAGRPADDCGSTKTRAAAVGTRLLEHRYRQHLPRQLAPFLPSLAAAIAIGERQRMIPPATLKPPKPILPGDESKGVFSIVPALSHNCPSKPPRTNSCPPRLSGSSHIPAKSEVQSQV